MTDVEYEIMICVCILTIIVFVLFGILSNEIEQLKATIKKDREAIADYLNELTIKNNKK